VTDEIDEHDDTGRRYRAPALEKGLEILELLAGEARPMPMPMPMPMWDPQPSPQELAAFVQRCDSIRARGHEMTASGFVAGVTDISAPVMRGGQAAAALTVPFVQTNVLRLAMEETVGHIEAAARDISEQLLRSDSRV
jgi:Bacterial transcriptional regulator